MADKLDQSLEDIMKIQRRVNGRPRRNLRRPGAGARTTAAPVGGVKKTTKPTKNTDKATVPTGPSGTGDSKIMVSNLPTDVVEDQIKEYFSKSIGPIKKVQMSYGPNGQSRGTALIVFSKASSAAEAAKSQDGLKVDGRPMKIEVIVGAQDAPAPLAQKSLGDRISKPKPAAKPQPKPATATKATGKKGKVARRGRNAGRGKPKSAEELDAEMVDYWETGANGAAGGAPAQAANGDTGMEEDNVL